MITSTERNPAWLHATTTDTTPTAIRLTTSPGLLRPPAPTRIITQPTKLPWGTVGMSIMNMPRAGTARRANTMPATKPTVGMPVTATGTTEIMSDSSGGCFGSCWCWGFRWSRSIRCSPICWVINYLTRPGCGGLANSGHHYLCLGRPALLDRGRLRDPGPPAGHDAAYRVSHYGGVSCLLGRNPGHPGSRAELLVGIGPTGGHYVVRPLD